MNDSAPEILINQVAESPALVAYLEANFQGANAHLATDLVSEADESPFPLRQWVEALLVFDQWLEARGLSVPIEDQIGYVTCSAEAGSAYSTLTQLPTQVEEMLENYGCDAAVKK
jgi:hypothetical protein